MSVIPNCCKHLRWDNQGYHRCEKTPTTEGNYFVCQYVSVHVFSNSGPDDIEEQKIATTNCYEHYTWEEMKAKVDPAVTLARKAIEES
jgi:hypothetical protein